MKTLWYILLVSTICLEGLGRKYLPQVPSVAFYFAKDAILLFGYFRFPPSKHIQKVSLFLYRGFGAIWVLGLFWTIAELFNPLNESMALGVLGLRAYWLWWAAPPLIASVLQDEKEKRRAIYSLLVIAAGITILAAVQFAAPRDAPVNMYSVVDGEEQYADQVMVGDTGHARVSSTFSYISGFSDFMVLVPTILLSLGLDAKNARLRKYVLVVTCLTATVLPMSGSRTSVLLGAGTLITTAFAAGLFFTRIGRRVLIGGVVAAILAVSIFPDAFIGVQSRFENTEETNERYALGLLSVLPPVAIATFNYPPMGIGTGMMQNARASFHIITAWEVELEVGRYLVELGPVGFLLVWTAKLGLVVALLRAYLFLKQNGRRGAAAAAVSYAILTLAGNLTFDHIWQALYFTGCGFILAEVVEITRLKGLPALGAPG
jgi:hypothetical protein